MPTCGWWAWPGGHPGRRIPLTWHAYPGDRPDVTQFATMIGQLRDQHAAVCAAAGRSRGMTVVFDAGQNSEDNFGYLAGPGCAISARCLPRTART